jgi:hypothetical protein
MISEKLKLDDVDRQIITLVQEDPNLTHTQRRNSPISAGN